MENCCHGQTQSQRSPVLRHRGAGGSFTRVASLLGVAQSALSQAISGLEARLEIRLLTRTTRSVSPTGGGSACSMPLGHRFDEIDAELDELTEMRDKPAGTVRITCGEHILRTTLLPKLTPFYPSRKQPSHAFSLVLDALRWTAPPSSKKR
jgi:DNA-binding transcriptional LysR family regulator